MRESERETERQRDRETERRRQRDGGGEGGKRKILTQMRWYINHWTHKRCRIIDIRK